MQLLKSLNRTFSSVRLAIFLIFFLAALSLLGALIPQVPSELASDPLSRTWWLENVAYSRLGNWALFLGSIGLLDVFHSFWFLGTGALLAANVVFCLFNRIRSARLIIANPRPVKSMDFYSDGALHQVYADIRLPAARLHTLVNETLVKCGYTVECADDAVRIFFSGHKNRLAPLGSIGIHLSLLIFIAGFIFSSYSGFRDASFIVAEGAERRIGFGTGISLRLDSFSDEYWPDGTPKDYRSEVVISENGAEVKRGTIRVNHPITYKGFRFFQAFFGPAVNFLVQDSGNKTLYQGGVPLTEIIFAGDVQRPSGGLHLSNPARSVFLIGRATNTFDVSLTENEIGLEVYEDNVPAGWAKLQQGTPWDYQELKFTFIGNTQYSGFLISRDPGAPLVWIASLIFLAGLLIAFYFPNSKIWLAIQPGENTGASNLFVKGSNVHGFRSKAEYLKVLSELQHVTGTK